MHLSERGGAPPSASLFGVVVYMTTPCNAERPQWHLPDIYRGMSSVLDALTPLVRSSTPNDINKMSPGMKKRGQSFKKNSRNARK